MAIPEARIAIRRHRITPRHARIGELRPEPAHSSSSALHLLSSVWQLLLSILIVDCFIEKLHL
jgi:hypothetical protein